jgi:hypothetical protein
MSTSLYYLPVIPTKKLGGFKNPLKAIISKKFLNHDGSLGSNRFTLDYDHIEYIEGLVDAGIEDADKLLSAIREYKMIEIWTEG